MIAKIKVINQKGCGGSTRASSVSPCFGQTCLFDTLAVAPNTHEYLEATVNNLALASQSRGILGIYVFLKKLHNLHI